MYTISTEKIGMSFRPLADLMILGAAKNWVYDYEKGAAEGSWDRTRLGRGLHCGKAHCYTFGLWFLGMRISHIKVMIPSSVFRQGRDASEYTEGIWLPVNSSMRCNRGRSITISTNKSRYCTHSKLARRRDLPRRRI